MCGIYGYLQTDGDEDPITVCIEGLKRLEYRGYDSAGVAGSLDGELLSHKKVGKVANLQENMDTFKIGSKGAIAHTRWATHGALTTENAHPHFDQHQTIALVHNGIIENYQSIYNDLSAKGITFTSQTDTEVLTQLISHNYQSCLEEAVFTTLAQIEGSFAFAMIHKKHPDTIAAVAKGCPLAIATDPTTKDVYISSDINAFGKKGLDIIFLSDGEVAIVSKQGIKLFDKNRVSIEKEKITADINTIEGDKGTFEHFMLKEIYEQPDAIRRTIASRFDSNTLEVSFEELLSSKEMIAKAEQILIIACGSSYHAGCITAMHMEAITNVPTRVEISSEFRYGYTPLRKNTLVIVISQSGETADTLAALEKTKDANLYSIGICNVEHSTLTREASSTLLLKAGPEISVCCTKAFTCQLTLLSLLMLYIDQLKQPNNGNARKKIMRELLDLPRIINGILDQEEEIASLAKKYACFKHFFFVGRRQMYFTAMEAALKLKEISYLNAESYPAGEMKHGPIALIDESLPTIAFCGHRETAQKTVSNIMEIKSRNGPILAFVPEGCDMAAPIATDVFFLPKQLSDIAAPIVYSVAAQIFGYHVAKTLKRDIDKPRNLAKSVTVE